MSIGRCANVLATETHLQVLGFEDHLKPVAAPSYTASFAATRTSTDSDDGPPSVLGHDDGGDGLTLEERQEGELEDAIALDTIPAANEGPFADTTGVAAADGSDAKGRPNKGKERASNRERAISDPFLDPQAPDGEAGADTPTLRRSPSITVSSPGEEPANGRRIALGSPRQPVSNFLDAAPASEIRTFRAPSYITNTEIRELVRLFPSFISTKAKMVRFGRNAGAGKRADDDGDAFVLRPGHGVVSISVFERDEGWRGGLFERIKLFILRLFGR